MKLKLSLILFFIYAFTWAQLKTHTFTASGSLFVPAGITKMNAKAWGGGGAGGAATQPDLLTGRSGAGGGSGAYAAAEITVVPGTTINTVVAVQTSGSASNGSNGGPSTITGFESFIYAPGGSGGAANLAGTTPSGGAGGPLATTVGATTRTAGGNGGNGATSLLAALFSSGAGGTAPNTAGGGGVGGAAIGSALGGVNSAGNPGANAGGGGSGAMHTNPSSSTTLNGGAGARGLVILDYTCTSYSLLSTVASNTCVTSGTSTVNLTGQVANLPIGTYTVTYSRSNPSATLQIATMTVTTAGTGSFTATGLTNVGTSTITVTNLASGDCTYGVTANNVSNALTISPISVGGSVTGGTTICSGFPSAQLTLSGHTGTVVKWQSSVSPFSTWADIANTLTTYTSGPLTQTTQFRAVVQSGTCASANSGFTTVTVNPLPTITLGTAATVCAIGVAQNTTLPYTATTNSPTTYSIVWNASPANTFAAVTNATLNTSPISIAVPAGTAAGTYTGTLTVRNANSCTSSPGVTFNVVVNPLPTITLGSVAPVCATGLAQNTTLAYTGTTETPTTYSIVWNASPANTFATVTNATLNTSPISIAVPAGTAAGTYTGTITVRNANSCTSSPGVAFNVVVNPLPTITLGAAAAVCATGLAQNTTLAYTATTQTPTTYSIVWNASPANTFTAVTNATLNTSPISIAVPAGTAAGTYTGTLTVRNANSCTSSPGVTFNVVVNPLPTITLGSVAPVCATGLAQNTTLAYTGTTESPTTYSIVWDASPTNSFVAVTNATLTTSPISIDVPAGTAAGTYTGILTVANSNSCVSSSGVAFSVDVNPLPAITLGTVAPVCSSASAQNTTLAYTGTTNSPTTYSIVWNASPTNSFVAVTNATLTNSPISIDIPAGTAPGTYSGTLTVTNANSCISSPGINFSVLINQSPSAPIIGAITPASCTVATGSIALSGLPLGGTLTLYPGEIIEPYSGTTATISGLSSNTYAFTVSNGICTSVISANAVVPSLVTNTYTTSWSNGTPTADQDIIFAGDFISAGGGVGDISACSCTVNAGVNITIQSLDTLTLTNSLSNNGGSVTFENNASLLQINNAINTGNITYKRTTTPILRGDFVYWSTPVNPQRLFDVSPLTLGDKYLAYSGDRWVITNRNTDMVIGKGYIIRAPQNYSNNNRVTFTASFIGKPNNGDLFGETVAAGKFYLIGNPYPSALDSDLFLSANLFLDGTLYFWTHNTPVPLVGLNRYNSDDYASYNFTGGVGAGTPALTGTPDNNNSTPTGKIGAGQSFFATANNAGTVAFTNNMRLGGIDNSQFYKSENTSNSVLERHRLWLNMTNSEGAFKQTLIGYIEGATNDFENKYDGLTFDGNPYLDFYSIANDNKYVIQGRALPFTDTDVVILGYRSTIAGDFTISIDHTDGDLSNHAIYIEDKVTNTFHNLKNGNYTFSTSTGTYTDRFVLTYVDKTLGSGEFDTNDKNVLVAVQNKVITITSSTDKVETIYIYDVSGKMIYKAANLSDTVVKIDNLKAKNQVLFVKVILETNAAETYKIVY